MPLELVEEVAREVSRAEDQPVPAARARGHALLQEGAVGRDAGPGADHDHVPRAVGGQAEARVRLDVDRHRGALGARRQEVRRRPGAPRVAAARVDARRGQVHLVADFTRARGDRVEAGRERPQRGNQGGGIPVGGVVLQQVDQLALREEGAQRRLLPGTQQRLERRLPPAFRDLRDQGPGHERDLEPFRQPLGERARPAAALHGLGAVEARGGEHGGDGFLRVVGDDPERVARLVAQPGSGERELDVAHVAHALAPGDALVGQDLGRERPFAAPGRDARDRPQDGDARGRGAFRRQLFRPVGDLRLPAGGRRLVIHVAVDPLEQAPRAQFGETRVDAAAHLAVLRVAGVAEREHGELERRQLRRAAAGQEVDQRARVVRRVAVAVGAHDDEQAPLAGEFLRRVLSGAHHAYAKAAREQPLAERLGDAPAVAGVRAVDQGCGPGRVSIGRRWGRGDCRREAGRVAGDPQEARRVEAAHQPGERLGALGVERKCLGRR